MRNNCVLFWHMVVFCLWRSAATDDQRRSTYFLTLLLGEPMKTNLKLLCTMAAIAIVSMSQGASAVTQCNNKAGYFAVGNQCAKGKTCPGNIVVAATAPCPELCGGKQVIPGSKCCNGTLIPSGMTCKPITCINGTIKNGACNCDIPKYPTLTGTSPTFTCKQVLDCTKVTDLTSQEYKKCMCQYVTTPDQYCDQVTEKGEYACGSNPVQTEPQCNANAAACSTGSKVIKLNKGVCKGDTLICVKYFDNNNRKGKDGNCYCNGEKADKSSKCPNNKA